MGIESCRSVRSSSTDATAWRHTVGKEGALQLGRQPPQDHHSTVAIFVAALVLCAMSRQRLGDFEQQVLLASLRIQGEVYAVPVAEEIERATGRAVSHAAVYIAMQRLEQRGLVKSRLGPRSDRPGGKQKRLYSVTRRAVNQLAESREAYERLWAGLDVRRLLEERTR
jgi:DNA-binding PadR family transcriptional regulator